MARPFWKGSLSFGLVEIGVRLRPARAAEDLSFTLLDRNDFSPVGNKRYNKRTGREVPWDRVVRGYEYEPDRYVVLTDDELRQANVEATQTIDLVAFVDRNDIDPIYFDTPYFVEPQQRSSRSYALLRATLEKTGLVGIVRIVLRTRQHVAALLVHDGVMMLDILRYAEELRTPADVEESEEEAGKESGGRTSKRKRTSTPVRVSKAAVKPSAAELKMATMLVEQMRGRWKPESFRDEYRRDVMALIRKKVKSGKTHEITVEGPASEPRQPREVVDLMAVLKQSLGRRSARVGAGRSSASAAVREPAKRRRRA